MNRLKAFFKNLDKKMAIRFGIIFLTSFIIFLFLTLLSNKVLAAYDVTSVRLSPVLNPILGIAYGWPAVIGCAIANLVSDIVSGYKPFVCVFGIFTQIIYGILPYLIWKLIVPSVSHKTRLDSPNKTIYFTLLMLGNSLLMGLFVGLFQLYTSGDQFLDTFVFAFLNDFDICIVLGIPLMAILDYFYSKNHQIKKRKLSFNEKIIIGSGILEVLIFAGIATSFLIVNNTINSAQVWKQIFLYSIIAMNIDLILSLIIMYVFAYVRKKHAVLRIIEKPNGTIFVDDKRRVEFISFPSVDIKDRTRTKENNITQEDFRKAFNPRYEKAWQMVISNQKGCPMKCTFCDCPGYGFFGNISEEEIQYQIDTIIDNVGVTHTELLTVDFMRMGEPSLNDNILKFLENSLIKTVQNKVNADRIVPTISTMLPRKNKDKVLHFLQEYCRIKNEVFNGDADLQFSINSTDENVRKKIFRNLSLSLEEIAEIAGKLPNPKGNKYALNFAITKDTVIDPEVLNSLFDKDKFYIKLTPIHQTFNAVDNGFVDVNEYSSDRLFSKYEKDLQNNGWETKVFFDTEESDDDSLTCGNLLMANISDKTKVKNSDKKRIGLCVAIEIDAVFKMYPNYKELEAPNGFKVYYIEKDRYDIYVIKTGMGEIAASSGVQYLISKYDVSMIINFGVVGGLTKEMKKEKVCVVNRVVHYKYDCSEFMDLTVGQVDGHDSIYLQTDKRLINSVLTLMDGLKIVTCCSGDKFISTAEEKQYLHETFNGDICDMESSGIVLTCEMNNVPCLLFKAVSDGLTDGAEGFYAELEKASLKCLKVSNIIIDKISTIE